MQKKNDNSENHLTIHASAEPTRKRRGEAAEAAFLARATYLGFSVCIPWGDSDRYDSVVELDRGFLRVQVKSATLYRRNSLPRQNHRSQRQSLYQQRNRLLRRLRSPRKHLVHHPHPGHRPPQKHPFLPHHPPPVESHVRKIPRSLVPPGFPPERPPPQRQPTPLPQQESGTPLRPMPEARLRP